MAWDAAQSAHTIKSGHKVWLRKEDGGKLIGIHYFFTHKNRKDSIEGKVVKVEQKPCELQFHIKLITGETVITHSEYSAMISTEL